MTGNSVALLIVLGVLVEAVLLAFGLATIAVTRWNRRERAAIDADCACDACHGTGQPV